MCFGGGTFSLPPLMLPVLQYWGMTSDGSTGIGNPMRMWYSSTMCCTTCPTKPHPQPRAHKWWNTAREHRTANRSSEQGPFTRPCVHGGTRLLHCSTWVCGWCPTSNKHAQASFILGVGFENWGRWGGDVQEEECKWNKFGRDLRIGEGGEGCVGGRVHVEQFWQGGLRRAGDSREEGEWEGEKEAGVLQTRSRLP